MLSKKFIDNAYNTRGNELCKYTRAEVMQTIEDKCAEERCTEEQFNSIVKDIMTRIDTIIKPMIEIEVDKL